MSLIRKNFLLLFIGNALAQGLSFVVAPLLTRIYSPTQFGILGIFVASINMMAVFSTARYHEAIVLPDSRKDACILTYISSIILVVFLLFSTVVCVLYGNEFFDLIGIKYLKELKYYLLVGLVVFSISQILNSWLLRSESFTSIFISRLAQSAAIAVIAIAAGYYENHYGLIFAEISGYLVSIVVIVSTLRWSVFCFDTKANWREFNRLMNEYRAFPTVNLAHSLADILQPTLTMYIIGRYYGFEYLGWYVFALRMLRAPLNLLSNSLGQLIYKKMINDHNNKIPLKNQIKLYIVRSLLFGAPVCFLLIIFSKDIFGGLFGPQWSNSGMLVSIMSPWMLLAFTSSLISNLPNVINKQKKFFLISLCGSILNIVVIVSVAELGFDFMRCITILTLIMALYTFLQLIWLYKIAKTSCDEVL